MLHRAWIANIWHGLRSIDFVPTNICVSRTFRRRGHSRRNPAQFSPLIPSKHRWYTVAIYLNSGLFTHCSSLHCKPSPRPETLLLTSVTLLSHAPHTLYTNLRCVDLLGQIRIKQQDVKDPNHSLTLRFFISKHLTPAYLFAIVNAIIATPLASN